MMPICKHHDTSFNEKMQRVMDTCTHLYKATGGKIQQTKIMCYCWRWAHHNGNTLIEELEAELVVHVEQTQ